ncbi:MAG: penicillin-binding transpeptidase domain-containing protein, partial [Myxococcota bacterium]
GLHLASHGFDGEPLALAQAYARVLRGRWLPPEETDLLKAMLEGAVERGTGDAAQIEGLAVGGKTGTARIEDGIGAWFIGAVPMHDPELLIAVYAEVDEGNGGSVAAPAFRRVVLQACDAGLLQGCSTSSL